MYDVIIIGAGVTGSAIARELSRYDKKVAVLERASDVCEGTSKANSGIVHAGYDATPGTLKAKLNVIGNQKMEALSRELDFSFRRNGSLVLQFRQEDSPALQKLMEKGIANGVEGLQLLTPEQVREKEPSVTEKVAGALYAPTGGIVCPFGLTIALAENACDNGVDFFFHTEVTGIRKESIKEGEGSFFSLTSKVTEPGRKPQEKMWEAKVVINAAGVYGDVIHNMICPEKRTIVARRGEYCLMDKDQGHLTSATIFQLPSAMGKGILVTPSVHGNLLVGPTAQDVSDKEGTCTTREGLEKVLSQGSESIPGLNPRKVITSFSGLRAHPIEDDFIIEEDKEVAGWIDVIGMESPGLSCAPAIGAYVADIVKRILPLHANPNFVPTRKGIPSMALASPEEKAKLIQENPAFAHVICRCEMVTEGEILSAIHRTLGATTLDGVKRRTRAGMGRCQAGFCSPKTLEILAREWQIPVQEITKAGGNSSFLLGKNKEVQG